LPGLARWHGDHSPPTPGRDVVHPVRLLPGHRPPAGDVLPLTSDPGHRPPAGRPATGSLVRAPAVSDRRHRRVHAGHPGSPGGVRPTGRTEVRLWLPRCPPFGSVRGSVWGFAEDPPRPPPPPRPDPPARHGPPGT